MKKRKELQSVFGNADPGFVNAVNRTLETIKREEEERHMKKFSTGLAIAIACIMLATAALAAANQWGVFDFVANRYNIKVLPQAQDIVQREFAENSVQAGDAIFSVREAVFDGQHTYIVLAVKPADDSVLLLGTDSMPADMASDLLGEERGEGLTIRDWAAKHGKTKLVHTNVGDNALAQGEESIVSSIDFITEEDGTLVYMLSGARQSGKSKLDVELVCISGLYDENESLSQESLERVPLAFELTASAANDRAQNAEPATYADCGVRVDRVTLEGTPMAVYYEIEYTVVDEAAYEKTDDGLWFEFLDEKGERLPDGATASGEVAEVEGSNGKVLMERGSLEAMETLPRQVTLRGYNCWEKNRYETHVFEMN